MLGNFGDISRGIPATIPFISKLKWATELGHHLPWYENYRYIWGIYQNIPRSIVPSYIQRTIHRQKHAILRNPVTRWIYVFSLDDISVLLSKLLLFQYIYIYIHIWGISPWNGSYGQYPTKKYLIYHMWYIYIYSYPPITHFPEVSPVEWEFYKVPNPFNSPKNRKYISRNY